MNAANFHEYLKNPSMLHQVNYHELKSLSLQYPYAANLRYLMLVKSLMDNKREYDRNLILASLSSPDRKKLHQLVKQFSVQVEQSENYEIAEEFLELKDLSTLEEVMEAGPTDAPATPPKAATLDHASLESNLEFLEEVEEAADVAAAGESATTEEIPELEELLEDFATPDTVDKDQQFASDESVAKEPASISTDADRPENPGNIEEIEETEEGLFEVDPEAPFPLLEEHLAEIATPAGEESTDEDLEAGDASEHHPEPEDLEDLLAEAPSTKRVPLEITNEEPAPDSGDDLADWGPRPIPKAAFASYRQVSPHKTGLLASDIPIFKKPKKAASAASKEEEAYEEPEDVAKEVAAVSLSEDHTIATETLAGILERQGHVDKAIKMYEKLSLQFPEKSSTFAAKIEKLKKK